MRSGNFFHYLLVLKTISICQEVLKNFKRMSMYPHPPCERDALLGPQGVMIMPQQYMDQVTMEQNRVSVSQIATTPPLSHIPQQLTCPFCYVVVFTRVEYETSMKTHLLALLSCPIIGWCCCCLAPYCKTKFRVNKPVEMITEICILGMNSCKIANHYCSSCDSFIGSNDGLKF